VANRLLRRVRDFAEVRHDGAVTVDVARAGLEVFDVDELGLDRLDLAILTTIVEKFGGGPVGLSTIAAAVGEETDTVEDVYEPYLLQLGFLQRTPRRLPAPRDRAGRRPPPRLAGARPAAFRRAGLYAAAPPPQEA
jgi:Holliday junction DNA helicase RuvB